jgi:hypothetical protein
MQRDPVIEATKRAQRYWYEDGIWEIGFGLLNLLLCGYYFLVQFERWAGPLVFIPLLLQVALIIGAGWLINRVVTFLKERITYPRTGYVAYRKLSPMSRLKRMLLTGAIAMVTAGLVGAVAATGGEKSIVPLAAGALLAGVMVYLGYRFGLARMYGMAVLLVILGGGIFISGLSDTQGSAVFFGGFGLLLLLSGGLTLLVYLRRTRASGMPASGTDSSRDEP